MEVERHKEIVWGLKEGKEIGTGLVILLFPKVEAAQGIGGEGLVIQIDPAAERVAVEVELFGLIVVVKIEVAVGEAFVDEQAIERLAHIPADDMAEQEGEGAGGGVFPYGNGRRHRLNPPPPPPSLPAF